MMSALRLGMRPRHSFPQSSIHELNLPCALSWSSVEASYFNPSCAKRKEGWQGE
jgi:hypothetical protein